ncbi:MAG: hypothetical protein Q8920_07525 [Bacillota bacterium]|nr:hypothetical protein [Bacillota bacterium]
MSFNLYFYKKKEAPEPGKAMLSEYFKKLHCFTVKTGDNGSEEFFYSNEETGVYFSFYYSKNESRPDFPDNYSYTGISLSIGCCRPVFFALEAMPVVESVQVDLGFIIQNPLEDTKTTVKYSQEELVQAWEKQNQAEIRAKGKEANLKYLSREMSLDIWKYSREKEKIQKDLGGKYYVPKIYIIHNKETGELERAISWPEAIPQVIPECEYVIVSRTKPGFLGFRKKSQVGILKYDYLMSKIHKYLNIFDGPLPGMKILNPFNKLYVLSVFMHMKISGIDKIEAIPMDGFVDVRA